MAIFTFIATVTASVTAWVSATFGLSLTAAAAVVQIGKALIWAKLSTSLISQPKPPRQQVQAVINQQSSPRVRAYGRVMLGGIRAFYEAKDGLLHQIVTAHHGPITSIVGYDVDGQRITFNGAGAATDGPAVGFLTVKGIMSGNGGAYSDVTTAFPDLWTVDHKLTGQATYYIKMKAPKLENLSKTFPRQSQTSVQIICDASPVLDTRTSTTAFSDNPGLCIRDYMISADGMRLATGLIDTASFEAFADLCDEPVALKAGGTEKRYRLAGYYTLEEAPKDVVGAMAAACDADIYLTADGKVGIMGGAWSEPDVTITSDDILSLQITDGQDEMEDFNVLKGLFISPDHRFQPTECAEWRDEIALATEPEKTETLEVEFCPSHTQMQRLMKIYRAQRRRRFTGTMRTNLVGLKARLPKGDGIHTIRIVHEEMGIDDVVQVTAHSYSVADKVCEIGIASIDNAYTWDAATEEGDPPPALDDLDRPALSVPVPTGLTPSQQSVLISGDVTAARLILTVDDPGNDALQLEPEFRVSGAATWEPMQVGSGDLRALTPVVADGQEYELRARWAGSETWATAVTITAVANPVAPDAPTSLAAVASGGVSVSWVNAEANFYRTRVYRSDTNSFAGARIVETVAGVSGQASSLIDSPGTGTWYYWATTLNASLVESSPAGSVSVTI